MLSELVSTLAVRLIEIFVRWGYAEEESFCDQSSIILLLLQEWKGFSSQLKGPIMEFVLLLAKDLIFIASTLQPIL